MKALKIGQNGFGEWAGGWRTPPNVLEHLTGTLLEATLRESDSSALGLFVLPPHRPGTVFQRHVFREGGRSDSLPSITSAEVQALIHVAEKNQGKRISIAALGDFPEQPGARLLRYLEARCLLLFPLSKDGESIGVLYATCRDCSGWGPGVPDYIFSAGYMFAITLGELLREEAAEAVPCPQLS